ncbi:hypothetical protein RvY_14695-2 [Ramazzottius varieornatus]|uniref:Uncharacterized protein n=1 Tax=Ramazzottius varieornatus TaxID=947166 RepID=A0A1D1VU24_RAMVA|nr:hypothetical protein RvY_14695-2 [Ramazzottius varieornatus]
MLRPHPGQEAHSFLMKVLTAAGAGAAGGFVGAPLDLVNVRMLNDVKAGATTARRYKHVFDGLVRICREEHPQNLYNGATMVVIRAICITVGQLSFYHQVKETLLGFDWFEDTIPTHLLCSAVAACSAATLAMPVDVMKTRMQNDATGQAKTIRQCFLYTLREGPLAFYKGYVPALTRIGFHTVITFLTFEQLRIRFGHRTTTAQES